MMAKTNIFGDDNALLAQLHVTTASGKKHVIITNDDWRWSDKGPIRESSLSKGQVYDARMEMEGWAEPGFDAGNWNAVNIADFGYQNLVPQRGASVVALEELTPVAVTKSKKGHAVFDLGQNIAGMLRLRLSGPAGTVIKIKFGEILNKYGGADDRVYFRSQQPHTVILRGEGEELYAPDHLFQGFCYVEVQGLPEAPGPDMMTGIVLSTDMEQTGRFECSHDLVNQFQKNVVWTQQNNFLEVPMDCPTREKSGWTGDLQVYCPTAVFNANPLEMLRRWLEDYAVTARREGAMPNVVPEISTWAALGIDFKGSGGWRDCAAVVPWFLYRTYGDEQILHENYPLMQACVDELMEAAKKPLGRFQKIESYARERGLGESPYIINCGFHFGDWLHPEDKPPFNVLACNFRPTFWLASAFFARSVDYTRRAARVIGCEEDAAFLGGLYDNIRLPITSGSSVMTGS